MDGLLAPGGNNENLFCTETVKCVSQRLRAGGHRHFGSRAQAFEDFLVPVVAVVQVNRRAVFHDEIDVREAQSLHRALQQIERSFDLLLACGVHYFQVSNDQNDIFGRRLIEIIDFNVAVHPWVNPADASAPAIEHSLSPSYQRLRIKSLRMIASHSSIFFSNSSGVNLLSM